MGCRQVKRKPTTNQESRCEKSVFALFATLASERPTLPPSTEANRCLPTLRGLFHAAPPEMSSSATYHGTNMIFSFLLVWTAALTSYAGGVFVHYALVPHPHAPPKYTTRDSKVNPRTVTKLFIETVRFDITAIHHASCAAGQQRGSPSCPRCRWRQSCRSDPRT